MNAIDKIFSQSAGYAVVIEGDGNIAAFDSHDEAWVRATAAAKADGRNVQWLRVSEAVTAAWAAGDWSRPVEVNADIGEIYFAGEGVAAAVFAGRRAATEAALLSAATPGRHQ